MIYIKYGPPDEREEHPTGGTYERPIRRAAADHETFPFEKWRYRYIPGLGNDVVMEFVDPTWNGEYHMTADPAEKDKLLYVPRAATTPEILDRFKRLQSPAAVAPEDAIEEIFFTGTRRTPHDS